jgi:hypothetical protein
MVMKYQISIIGNPKVKKIITMLLLFCTTVLAQYCPNGSYVNSYGNTVCRPSSSNAGGATAVCKDGTYSYSQSRRGTCSGHGGVAQWLENSEPIYEQPTYEQPVYEQPVYKQPTYKQPTYEQPRNKTSYSSSSESIDFSKYIEIGYQRIWDMDHFRWSYSWFYNTIGVKEFEDSSESELIVGGIYRWGILKSITIGFGLFGGLGARRTDYLDCDNGGWGCDEKTDINIRHELGIELILGVISLYIAERNFYQIGGGIGLIF